MKIIRTKPAKLHTVLTTFDSGLGIALETQRQALANFALQAPRVLIGGTEEPAKPHGGVRWIKGPSTIRNLLGTYMQSIPGREVCLLTNPDLLIGDPLPLLNHVDDQRMEMAWACNLGNPPIAFVLSSPVVVHLMNDLPGLTFRSDWRPWVHDWMQRLLRQRYFDGTPFKVVTPFAREEEAVVPEPVPRFQYPKLASTTKKSEPLPRPKRGNVRRVPV